MSAGTRQRQADRSRETKRKLMEATVDCLVERGWAGTTTVLVAERAGVSRGAQLHHFRTRGELVAAAVEYVGVQSVQDMLRRADALRDNQDRTLAVVEFIAELDTLVADLPPERWRAQTPAAGWTIAHQIAHLTWTDRGAVRAATDPEGFTEIVRQAMENPSGFTDAAAEEGARIPPGELLRD